MSLALSDPDARFAPMPRGERVPAPVPLDEPLGTLGLLRGLRANPIATWTKYHFEHPIVIGTSVLGRVAVVSEPSAIRHVLVENADNYGKGILQRRMLAPGLGSGLLLAEGAEWRAQRRALAPLFVPRHVLGFQASMAEIAAGLVHRWRHHRDGRRVDVSVEMARVTLRILARTIFSDGLTRTTEDFAAMVSRYLETIGQMDPLDVLGMPDWVPRWGRIRSRPMLDFFEKAVASMVARRRAAIEADPAHAPRDLLTLLLQAVDPDTGQGLSETEIKANLVTFIVAGHETTSNTLTWALYLLSVHPEARAAVEREVDRLLPEGVFVPGTLEALVETRAAIDEAMRLYPPAASFSRQALGPDRIGDHPIKAGTLVVVAPYVLHRHKRLWKAPDHFAPERFLPQNRGAIDRFAYLPFGAGPRVCIGASFAIREAVVVLATILRAFRLSLVPGHAVMPVQRVALRPRGGMPMLLHRR